MQRPVAAAGAATAATAGSMVVEKAALLPSAGLATIFMQPSDHSALVVVADGGVAGDDPAVHNEASSPIASKSRSPRTAASGSVPPANNTQPSARFAVLLDQLCPHPVLEREVKIKVVVLGGPGVGKSAVVRSIRNMPFVASVPSTVGYDVFSLMYNNTEDGRQIRVELWDVSHREVDCDASRWARIIDNAAAVLLVCATSSPRSLTAVDVWRARVASARPLTSCLLYTSPSPRDRG